jgi:hypothetical protein
MDMTIGYKSEFRPIGQIRHLLRDHRSFPLFEEMADNGMDYKFASELTEDQRQAEVARMLERGNHKSAQESPDETEKILQKEVKHGFTMPCQRDVLMKLPVKIVQPCGLVRQFTLQDDGTRAEKCRLTHDLSFSAGDEKLSINDRIDMSR